MRVVPFYICSLFLLASCTTIDNLEPNQTNTFLKIYSESRTMNSSDLLALDDGYLILSIYNETNTLLLKTDLLGNKLWASSLDNFKGNSLAVVDDGYIIIGTSINNQTLGTSMEIIKTNTTDGTILNTDSIDGGFNHGSAITVSSSGNLIASGYTSTLNMESIIIMEYDNNLNKNWDTLRRYSNSSPSKSIFEQNGLISWLSYSNTNQSVNITEAEIDRESPKWNDRLFGTETVADFNGDIAFLNTGYSIVQTIAGANTKIGVAFYNNGNISTEVVINNGGFASGNYTAASLLNIENGILVLATTDVHTKPGEEARKDIDLLLLELNYDGTVKSEGINETFGGLGDEIPMRIRKTKDGGYAVLGTVLNTKDVQQIFLLKTNKNGLLE